MDLIAPLLTTFAVVTLVIMLCWPARARPHRIRTRSAISRPVPSLARLLDADLDADLDPGRPAMWPVPVRRSNTLRYPAVVVPVVPHPDQTTAITLPTAVPEPIDPEITQRIYIADDDARTGRHTRWLADSYSGVDGAEVDDGSCG